MKWTAFVMAGILLAGFPAGAQDMMEDVFSGKLINPEVGVFAWYDLTDGESGKKYFLRQAIVGEEKVKRKQGWWVETEIIPEVGFPAVYKMLLTGPASENENIHEIIVKEGQSAPRPVPLPESDEKDKKKKKKKPDRESLGEETIALPNGDIKAEHVVIQDENGKTEVWLNDNVRPMGIVRMLNKDGELMLHRFGKGGNDAMSAISSTPGGETGATPDQEAGDDGPQTNFKTKGGSE